MIVADDGVGFETGSVKDDGKRHLGIENSRFRLKEMVAGTLEIASEPGVGTTVTIEIPRQPRMPGSKQAEVAPPAPAAEAR